MFECLNYSAHHIVDSNLFTVGTLYHNVAVAHSDVEKVIRVLSFFDGAAVLFNTGEPTPYFMLAVGVCIAAGDDEGGGVVTEDVFVNGTVMQVVQRGGCGALEDEGVEWRVVEEAPVEVGDAGGQGDFVQVLTFGKKLLQIWEEGLYLFTHTTIKLIRNQHGSQG